MDLVGQGLGSRAHETGTEQENPSFRSLRPGTGGESRALNFLLGANVQETAPCVTVYKLWGGGIAGGKPARCPW